jgi:phage recombination protein Bet
MAQGKEVVEYGALTAILDKFKPEELALITETVAKDATKEELAWFLYNANLRGLNPLTRQIHFVKRGGTGTIQTGIDGFRLIAQRTGQYAPSPKPTHFEYDGKNLLRATVFGVKLMGNQAFEFSATAKFTEYAQYFNGQLGNMWKKMPETMLEKCAEAKLLRRGFPEELSGIYSDDEMQQADSITMHEAEQPSAIQIPVGGQEEKPLEEENPNPYARLLHTCPEHRIDWKLNSLQKKYHMYQEEGKEKPSFCNFRDQIKIMGQTMRDEMKMSDGEITDICKELYEGRTFSKLTEEEQVNILWEMQKRYDAKKTTEPNTGTATETQGEETKKEDSPLVAEAKRLGGVETSYC